MTSSFAMVGAGLLFAMALTVARAVAGPTLFDRILAANSFGTKTVLLLSILGFIAGRPHFLDLALVYALINFLGVIAALKLIKFGRFSDPDPPISA